MSKEDTTVHLGPVLRGLPQERPPEHLWGRILETRLVSESRRRRRLGIACGVLAAALLVALGAGLRTGGQSADRELPALQTRAQLLEERALAYDLASARLSPVAYANLGGLRADLLAVDQALSRAYAEGRTEAELAGLWRRRVDLLGRLIETLEAHAAGAEAL